MIASSIKRFLEKENIDFQVVEHEEHGSLYQAAQAADIPLRQVARTVVIGNSVATFMAILPASHLLDFKVLSDQLKSELNPKSADDLQGFFNDCEPGCRPPFPALYKMQGLVDAAEFKDDFVYLEPGTHQCFIRVARSDFMHILTGAEDMAMSCPPENLQFDSEDAIEESLNSFTPKRIKQRIDETFDLPALPDIASEILRLRVNPAAEAKDLADIVSKDPSLAAQVISWASSPYYGYQGDVTSVEVAISRVLGFDLVMNLVLGIAIGKSLSIPDDGPLGLSNFWRQSVYCAAFSERICTLIPAKNRPQRGLVYLSGLLHNFGHLLLSHLFPPQFFIINRYVETNSAFPVETIERHVLGVTHEEMGAWLLRSWNMPEEITYAIRHHHNPSYTGTHSEYANIIMIANCMLKRLAIGDGYLVDPPAPMLKELGIEQTDIENLFEKLVDRSEELDMMTKQMVA